MLRQRDHRILRYIEDFGVVSCSQIKTLFFPEVTIQRCRQRLTSLVAQGQLKRWRDNINNEYLYYTDRKPKEVLHMLLRGETYIKLTKDNKLCDFIPEYEFGNIKADAYFEVWKNGYVLPYFLEVQLSSNFRQEKYEREYNNGAWVEQWEEFPTVLVVSDNRIRYKPSNVRFVQLSQSSEIKL